MQKEAEAEKTAPTGVAVGYSQAPPSYQSGSPAVVYQPQAVVVPQDGLPQDHLVMSILTTFLCFWPLGIIAVLKSIETRGHNDRGDFESARASSKQALLFNKLAILIGIIVLVVVVVMQLAWIIPIAVITATFPNDN